MNILNFIKNAWKLRKELSSWQPNSYKKNLNFYSKLIELQINYYKELISKYSYNLEDKIKALTAYKDSLDIISKDKFIENAAKIVLKETFDANEWKKDKFNYILNLPEKTQEDILLLSAKMFDMTLDTNNKIIRDKYNGLDTWYTII